MITDENIKLDILEELIWEPSLDMTKFGVSVRRGVVKLNGEVKTFTERSAIERAALKTSGVKSVVNNIITYI